MKLKSRKTFFKTFLQNSLYLHLYNLLKARSTNYALLNEEAATRCLLKNTFILLAAVDIFIEFLVAEEQLKMTGQWLFVTGL